MSQRELAHLADISPTYPGNLERSLKEPVISGQIAIRIAEVFGCTIPYLVNGDGVPPTEEEARAAVAAARLRRPPLEGSKANNTTGAE